MLILYYIVFIHSYKKYGDIVSELLVKDSINGDLILELLNFMQKKEYSKIFIYNKDYNHNPTFIIKHYLIQYIVKNENKIMDAAKREIASMDNIKLANKICKVLGIPLSSSATTINATTSASTSAATTSATSAATTSAAGSRKRRNNKRHSKKRKSISSKKHINK